MIDPDRLAEVAIGGAVRVRDDDPEANLRWLRAQVRPDEYEALIFVLFAAVPIEVSWSTLTEWTHKVGGADTIKAVTERRRILNEALSPRRGAA
jgi:hypothetical protein